MQQDDSKNLWVWVVVQNPGAKEQFLGQYDSARKLSFIPAFHSREEAQAGLTRLTREPQAAYEVQAVLLDEITRHAARSGFWVFLLDVEGNVLESIAPNQM